MQIEYIDNLLQTSMTIRYKGQSLTIDHLVIDTRAAHSLLSSNIAAQIGIHFENGDTLIRSFGIIGDDHRQAAQADEVPIMIPRHPNFKLRHIPDP